MRRGNNVLKMYTPAIFIALAGVLVFWRDIDESARGAILVALGVIVVLLALSARSQRRTREALARHREAIEAGQRARDGGLDDDDDPEDDAPSRAATR